MVSMGYATVLLLDSEGQARQQLEEWLPPRGYDLHCAPNAAGALAHLQIQPIDLVVLGFQIEDGDCLRLCQHIYDRWTTPLLMLGSAGRQEVAGLEAGADDFLPLPLELDVTVARIRALLRRVDRARGQDVISVGDLHIHRSRMQASVDDRGLDLTLTELKILTQMALAPNRTTDREKLTAAVWNSPYLTNCRLIDTHVRNLRRKLRQAGSSLVIHPVRGKGYRMAPSERAGV